MLTVAPGNSAYAANWCPKCADGSPTTRRSETALRPSASSTITCCCVPVPPRQSAGGKGVIEFRRAQLNFGDKLIADEVEGLDEDWMRHVDEVLADEEILTAVYEALGKRHAMSRTRGRRGFSAEVVLRLLVLKHVRNWSYAVLEREVRANLVYRNFTRVGFAKMPDAKTMGGWGRRQFAGFNEPCGWTGATFRQGNCRW